MNVVEVVYAGLVGRAFQSLGAAIENEQLPANFLELGTCRVVWFEEQRLYGVERVSRRSDK